MRILLVTVGTRGDVQPFIALALALRAKGHEAIVASHREHRALVETYGVPFRNAGASMREVLESDIGRDWIESSDSFFRYEKAVKRVGDAMWPEALGVAAEMVDGVEAVLMHPFALHAAHHAEALKLPMAVVSLIPIASSREQVPIFFPGAPGWGWLRNGITNFTLKKIYQGVEHTHEPHRHALGLGPLGPNAIASLRAKKIPFMHLYSEQLSPRPSDWPDDVTIAGFCSLPAHAAYSPPDRLTAFLEAKTKPIYVGFGSMTGRDPQELARTTLAAIRRAGVRAVVCTGWGGLGTDDTRDDVCFVDDVPHDWLFPRVHAVVHHGGAGTLAAGLRAGRPTAIAAFFADQPFWGAMAARAGVGPPPLQKREVDEERLAALITRLVSEPTFAANAEKMQAALLREDGADVAATTALTWLSRPRDSFWGSYAQ